MRENTILSPVNITVARIKLLSWTTRRPRKTTGIWLQFIIRYVAGMEDGQGLNVKVIPSIQRPMNWSVIAVRRRVILSLIYI